MDELPTGLELYEKLPDVADRWRRHLTVRYAPVVELAADYGVLVSRAVRAMGLESPASRQEAIVRDLIADTFDFLYEWPRPLFEGRQNVAWPLARRAFESLTLACVCHQDGAIAAKWDSGKQISNGEIRRALSKGQMAESADGMKEFYRMFSSGTHPNRDLVGERFLGAGNQFVLGSMGEPEFVVVLDHCCRLVDMWFWFGAFVGSVAREPLGLSDPTFGKDYFKVAERAADVKQWAVNEFNIQLAARKRELRAED